MFRVPSGSRDLLVAVLKLALVKQVLVERAAAVDRKVITVTLSDEYDVSRTMWRSVPRQRRVRYAGRGGCAVSDAERAEPSKRRLPSPGCLFAHTMLVIVASVAWIGWGAHRQRARLECFEKLGAVVETQRGKPVWVHELVFATTGSEPAQGFTDITSVDLGNTLNTDANLQHLRGLPHLQVLHLQATDVGSGLQSLSGLSSLRELDLSDTRVTDADLQHLGGLTKLERLDLTCTNVTDAGLQHLNCLENLKELHSGTRSLQTTDSDTCRVSPICAVSNLTVRRLRMTASDT